MTRFFTKNFISYKQHSPRSPIDPQVAIDRVNVAQLEIEAWHGAKAFQNSKP